MASPIEQKYFEKLNISCLGIGTIKNLIKSNIKNTIKSWEKGIDVKKQCFHIIGPAGVGKTDIMNQITNELTEELNTLFTLIIIKAPVLTRDDMILPFPIIDNGNSKFKMLYSDFVPDDEESFGLFVIDECSRGDHAFQQLMWQVQNETSIHTKKFPKGWFVVSIDNPDDREYSMNILEDAAGLRRQLHVYVQLSTFEFLEYAKHNNFHSIVVDFIETYPEYLYDFESQKIGSVYSNPASWERVSDTLHNFEQDEKGLIGNIDHIEFMCSGWVNVSMSRILVDFIKDRSSHISPSDIFYNYDSVKSKILTMIKKNENANLSELVNSLCLFLSSTKPEYKDDHIKNISEFLSSIPIDTAVLFAMHIDNFRSSPKEYKYLLMLNKELTQKSKVYREMFFERLATIGA